MKAVTILIDDDVKALTIENIKVEKIVSSKGKIEQIMEMHILVDKEDVDKETNIKLGTYKATSFGGENCSLGLCGHLYARDMEIYELKEQIEKLKKH